MEAANSISSFEQQSKIGNQQSKIWWLGACLGLGLALRVGAVVAFQFSPAIHVGGRVIVCPATHPLFPDTIEYLRVAENVRLGKGFMVSDDCLIGRMPGYPVFLALIQIAFGESMLAARLAQALVGTALIAIAWLLARELYGEREAHVAAAFVALYPPFILYTVLLLSETLFTALVACGGLWLARAVRPEAGGQRGEGEAEDRKPSDLVPTASGLAPPVAAILAGVFLGLATLVRASLLLFIGLAAVAWVLARLARCLPKVSDLREGMPGALGLEDSAEYPPEGVKPSGGGPPGGKGAWRATGLAALMLATFALTMAPWVVRNYSASGGHFVTTTLRAGASLYEALNPAADGGPMMEKIDWDWGTKGLGEWERDQLWRQRAAEFARENPVRVLDLALRKLGRFWNPMPNATEFQSPVLVGAMAPPFAIAAALGLVGLWASRRRGRALLILLLPVVYYSGLHTVFVSSIRYRDPVMPFILILAACGATRLWGGRGACPDRNS